MAKSRAWVTGFVLLAISSLGGIQSAEAWTVTVAWDANPPAESVTGYVVHYGAVSRAETGFTAYQSEVDVGNVTQWSLDLPNPSATYYVAVTAYNQFGLRSDYSAELSVT